MSEPASISVFVAADGTVRYVHDDDVAAALAGLGQTTTKRASHVEPGRDGQWYVDLSPVGGDWLGPFPRRDLALEAERLVVEAKLAGVPPAKFFARAWVAAFLERRREDDADRVAIAEEDD